ncbi:TPA: dihydrolipoyl dehydrogenase [Candidatus Bipolaricaulota bacterium]|nr:dihydrolipoyl dehydrogenase [Candidatus Bipolaricaulota bacterium]
MKTDLLIIGSGPGGYVAAIRAAQLGKEVILVEQDRLGGVCLNVGCIPSKTLIHAANLYHKIPELSSLGISVTDLRLDLGSLRAWKEGIVERLREGIAKLLKANGVMMVQGRASFISREEVRVEGLEGQTIGFTHCILAAGSRPLELPGLEFDHELVLDSTDALALELEEVPEALLVVGGGYIGLELGTLYAKLGSKVTVVEMMDRLLPGTPSPGELVRPVERRLRELGVEILLKAKAKGLRRGRSGSGGGGELVVETPEGEERLEAEKILQAVGRRPNTAGLGLEKAEVRLTEGGFIEVDGQLRTANPRIFAIGDLVGPPMLAHKASHEGLIAAEAVASAGLSGSRSGPGLGPSAPFRAIPAVIFSDPEIAYVGLSEAEAKAQGRAVLVGRFPFAALGRAVAMGETEGFVKIIADARSRAVLGVEIVGPEASNLIGEAALAVETGATLEDLARTVHPHPTLPEGLMEAARAALERPIHILLRRKGPKRG